MKQRNNDKLYIKAFGPLKEVEISLSQINILIGKNGSGKSVLAKIITIVLDFKNHVIDQASFFQKFQDFNINYITKETVIQFFVNQNIILELKNNHFDTIGKFDEPILQEVILRGQLSIIDSQKLTSQYIPAERNLISLFSKSLSSFIVSGIPLPKFLLHFSSQYEKARQEIKELEFLDMKYINNGKDIIYYNKEEYLDLEHSSSGIQSSLPLYLTVKYFAKKHKSIIIEEPELNLFPKAQFDIIEYILKQVSQENDLFMMTHSPYILSALNIFLYAHKVGNLNAHAKAKVSQLYHQESWINADNFSAYYLENGTARDIKSSRGLISDNEIDDISEELAEKFDDLLHIYREENAH